MTKDQDYEALCPYLLWLPIDHIKHTLNSTTQWFHNVYCIQFCKHFKSCFPATNSSCHNKLVAMFSNEPALGSNTTSAKIFICRDSKYNDIYGAATDCDLSHALEEITMNQGAMDVLISDNAHTATSQKVKDILHMYCIKSCNQHQNYTECWAHQRHHGSCTHLTGASTTLWKSYLMYVVYIVNITTNNGIVIFPLTSIYIVKHQIFLPEFVSDSVNQPTTQVLILFLPPLRKGETGWFCP